MRIETYDLSMAFDPPARRFTGRVEIHLTTDAEPLVLQAAGLTLGPTSVDGRPVDPVPDPVTDELRVPTGPAGPHQIRLEFAGTILPDGLAGMYVSPFGPGQEILTTQMYPAGARRFFPCVDLPAVKAVFHVTVAVPAESAVVFNTDPVEDRRDGDIRRIRFAPTPRMSTYLLYFGIGPFEETRRTDGNLRTIVAHPAGRSRSAAFALDHAARYVREYESYYAIPYPLPKLHLVAVPSFWAGAMENWGAIAFRETALLVDERTDAMSRRWNRLVLCHEIAHQWFGNLVTNAWWSDFWLNEAFATFVASRIIDRVHPGEAAWSDFVQRETGRGFSQDVLDCAHPVEVPINGPDEIGEIADGITYGKGASVLRMIEAYLGEPAFRRGVTAYLNAHRYDAARTADLWTALDANSDVPVSRIMREWVGRPGHPVLEIGRDDDGLVVTQRRFHADGRADPSHWPVPLVVEVDGVRHRTLLEGDAYRVPAKAGAKVRVDPDRTGFYHLRYAEALGREIVDRWDELSELDQWGLLVDRGFFLTSGDATLPEYLAVVEKASRSDRYLPSLTAARELRGYRRFREKVPTLQAAYRQFYQRQFERLGPSRRPGEPEATGVLRSAVGWGLLDADEEARHRFAQAFQQDEAAIDRDLLDVATTAYVQEGGASAWEVAAARVAAPGSDEEAFRFATSLPDTHDPACYDRTLELLEGPSLSASRIWDVLRAANGPPAYHARLWGWYQVNLGRLEERWKGTPLLSLLMPETIPTVGFGRGDAVRAYFDAHPYPSAERGIREGLERLRLRERLADRLGALATTGRPTG
ncbi:MAG: M1 family metallopeptidase [Thermoplasmata archaeon]|nr:M1 family metallopeptidase [Thermoplasmata archaeon]